MTPDDEKTLNAHRRTSQIVCGALIFGQIAFTCVAIALVQLGLGGKGVAAPQGGFPILTAVMSVMAAFTCVAALVLPGIVFRKTMAGFAAASPSPPASARSNAALREMSPLQKLLMSRWTSTIIGVAMFESAGFMSGIAYLVEGQPLILIGSVVAIVAMSLKFPTEEKLAHWVTLHTDELNWLERGSRV